MTVELDRLRSLASVIEAAEDELAAARWTLRETAVALLRCGEATLAEITRASGVEEGELLELLDLAPDGTGSRETAAPFPHTRNRQRTATPALRHVFRFFIPRPRRLGA